MAKYAIYHELDDDDKDTGRVQVVEEGDDLVMDTFNTLEEAEATMVKMQAESDRNDQIKSEYLAWEKVCLSCHPDISQEDLRVFLVNSVMD